MGILAFLGLCMNFIMLGVLSLGNRGEAGAGGDGGAGGSGGAAAPAPITSESLGAIQGDSFRALMPEEFRGKPYAKNINNFGDLVKGFDGAQTLLGQRAFPDDKSTPEQWGAFHEKHRPATADAYKVDAVDGVPADYLQKIGDNKELKGLLHAASVSPYQAKILLSGIIKTLFGAEQKVGQARDAAFTKMVTETFGDKKDAILANGKAYLAANLPDNVKPLLSGMDDKQLAVVIAAIDSTVRKFSGEDPFRGSGAGTGGSGAATKDALVAQMQTIMKDPCWSDPFKDRPKHAQLQQQMDVIRGKLKALQAGV